MMVKDLISSVATHVRNLFKEHPKAELLYHDIEHTESVVKACDQIADHYQLEEQDYTAVVIASWFHDVGYLFVRAEDHEEYGVKHATEFLKAKGCDDGIIQKVKECILATKMPQNPQSLNEKIVCDADLFHLGTTVFYDINKKVRKEYSINSGEKIGSSWWNRSSLALLEKHQFHTDYCRALLQKGKEQNIELLKNKISKSDKLEKKESKRKRTEENKKEAKPSRGIETMFRTTSTNHLRLSEMADSKANIMISVNSIIASILVSMLFRKLDDDSRLLIPAILFLATALISIVFAILVTRPNITRGTFTKEDIDKKRANLLFFGNFHKMRLKDYQAGINAMMEDSEFLYGSMTRDIYNLGVVLGRKYRLLRVAYSVFMFGFIVSVLAFVIAVTAFDK